MKKTIILLFLVTISIKSKSQESFSFSAGLSLPDNIINEYLSTGAYLKYGIDFKLTKKLYINTGISVSFNNKNKNYGFGVYDHPYLTEDYPLNRFLIAPTNQTDMKNVLYLFNSAININTKYYFFSNKQVNPYISIGVNFNYSIYEDTYYIFEFEGKELRGYWLGGDAGGLFSIGYNTNVGIDITIKENKCLFLEVEYNKISGVVFSKYKNKTGLFFTKFGIRLPFK